MARRLDGFDKFLKEHRERKTPEKRILPVDGVDYEIAPVLPASVVLKIQRLQRDIGSDGEVPSEAVFDLADAIFGPGKLEEIAQTHSLSMPELEQLVEYVVSTYNDTEEQATEPDPTIQAEEGQSTYSPNGSTSKQTSDVNTVSS